MAIPELLEQYGSGKPAPDYKPSDQHYINVHISGIPSPCCRAGRLDEPLAIGKCSGSGRHAACSQPTGSNIFGVDFTVTYVADSPGYSAFLARSGRLVGLALDTYTDSNRFLISGLSSATTGLDRLTEIHDVVPADCAVVNDDVPSPQCDGVPLNS